MGGVGVLLILCLLFFTVHDVASVFFLRIVYINSFL
jgi:hypothetical protein